VLRPHILLYTGMSSDAFAEEIGRIPTKFFVAISGDDSIIHNGVVSYELDISKYDKSQREVARDFLYLLYKYFGMSDEMAELWYFIHLFSTVSDLSTGLRVWIMYMMRSGVTETWLGNTLYNLGVIAYFVPLLNFYAVDIESFDLVNLMALTFNLEVKLISGYKYMYFCSKFLFRTQGKWYFVPDPLKIIIKLGRHDIVNEMHREQMRVSLIDQVRHYANPEIARVCARAITERYQFYSDYSELIQSLANVVTPHVFHNLYYSLSGDNVDRTRMLFYDEH